MPPCAPQPGRVFHQSGPQTLAALQFGAQTLGGDEAIAVLDLAIAKGRHVQHAVAVEGMVATQRRKYGVLRVAQIDTIDVRGNRALDHAKFCGIHLFKQGRPRVLQVRMITCVNDIRQNTNNFRCHFFPITSYIELTQMLSTH